MTSVAADSAGPVASNAKAGRIECLDAFRGLAALWVLWFHVYNRALETARFGNDPLTLFWVSLPTKFGETGVALFFVLSGFVIHYSTLRAGNLDVGAFFWRRFWRLYPAYSFALVVFLAVVALTAPLKGLGSFLLHFFALNHVSEAANRLQANASYWSLAVEIHFYLLYPLFYWMRCRWACGRALAVTLVVAMLSRAYAAVVQDWDERLVIPLWHNTHTLWFDWALGAYVAEQWFHGKRTFQQPWAWVAVFLPLFLVSPYCKPLHPLGFTFGSILAAAALDAAMWSPAPTGWLRRGFDQLAAVGVYSYSLYLLHGPPIPMLDRYFGTVHLQSLPLKVALLGIGSTVVLCLLAWLAHRTVEVDGEALGRRLWKKIRPDPPGPQPAVLPVNVDGAPNAAALPAAPSDVSISGGPPATDATPRS